MRLGAEGCRRVSRRCEELLCESGVGVYRALPIIRSIETAVLID